MDEKQSSILCAKIKPYMGQKRTTLNGDINGYECFRGYKLNNGDRNGNTPLHVAIVKQATDCYMRLIQFGSRRNVKKNNRERCTSVMYAVNSDNILLGIVIEQDCFGNTTQFYTCFTLNVAMLDLLTYFGADTRFQSRAVMLEAVNAAGVSTLSPAINYETPLWKEISNRRAHVKYIYKNQVALRKALRTSNPRAFDLVWPTFDYQRVYASYYIRPLLCEFFDNSRCRRQDWLYRFHTIVSDRAVIKHAVQHYTSHNYLPPLVSQVVKSFAKRNFSETKLFTYVSVLVSYGARVFLKDIETVYICCGDSSRTAKFLLDVDVEVEQSGLYSISHPYVMFKINRDVDGIFNNHRFCAHFVIWTQQLIFLPTLFKFCTPPYRFICKLYSLYNLIRQKYINQEGFNTEFLEAVTAAYKTQIDPLMTNTYCFPSLVELSRNAARNAICSWYNIERYSEYRRLLRNFGLPGLIVDILLFRRQITNIDIPLPNINAHRLIRNTIRRY